MITAPSFMTPTPIDSTWAVRQSPEIALVNGSIMTSLPLHQPIPVTVNMALPTYLTDFHYSQVVNAGQLLGGVVAVTSLPTATAHVSLLQPLSQQPVRRGPRAPYHMTGVRVASGLVTEQLVWYQQRGRPLAAYFLGKDRGLYLSLHDARYLVNRIKKPRLETLRNQNAGVPPPTYAQFVAGHFYPAIATRVA